MKLTHGPRHDDRQRHQPDRLDDRRQGGPVGGRGHGRRRSPTKAVGVHRAATRTSRSSCTSRRTTSTSRACPHPRFAGTSGTAPAATRSTSSTGASARCWRPSTGSSWPTTRWSSSPATTAPCSTTATPTARRRTRAATSPQRPAARARRAALYEGGHRVPFIARWPGKVPAGQVSNELVCQVDLMATLAAAGRPAAARRTPRPDSFDVLPALLGQPHDKPVRESCGVSRRRRGRAVHGPAGAVEVHPARRPQPPDGRSREGRPRRHGRAAVVQRGRRPGRDDEPGRPAPGEGGGTDGILERVRRQEATRPR